MRLEELKSMQAGGIFPKLYQEGYKQQEISFIYEQYLLFYKDNPKEATQNLIDLVIEYHRNRPASHELLGQYIEKNVLKNRLSA